MENNNDTKLFNIKSLLFSDYFITAIVSMLVMVSGLVSYRLAHVFFGDRGFDFYALMRRTISFILPVIMLGVGVALPKELSSNTDKEIASLDFLLSGLLLSMMGSGTAITILLTFRNFFARVFFDSSTNTTYIYVLCFVLVALSLNALCYSYFRGNLQMLKANILQFISTAFIPILIFFISFKSVLIAFLMLALLVMVVSIIVLMDIFQFDKRLINLHVIKKLLSFGLPRVPGDFALSLLLYLPTGFSIFFQGVEVAATVSFSMTLITLVAALTSSISIVLLPRAGRMLNLRGGGEKLSKEIKILLVFSLTSTVFLIISSWIFSDFIIGWFTGYTSDLNKMYVFRSIALSTLPFSIYYTLRSAIDAAFHKPINAYNTYIAFIIFGICVGGSWLFNGEVRISTVLVSFNLSGVILAILTLHFTGELIKKKRLSDS